MKKNGGHRDKTLKLVSLSYNKIFCHLPLPLMPVMPHWIEINIFAPLNMKSAPDEKNTGHASNFVTK